MNFAIGVNIAIYVRKETNPQRGEKMSELMIKARGLKAHPLWLWEWMELYRDAEEAGDEETCAYIRDTCALAVEERWKDSVALWAFGRIAATLNKREVAERFYGTEDASDIIPQGMVDYDLSPLVIMIGHKARIGVEPAFAVRGRKPWRERCEERQR